MDFVLTTSRFLRRALLLPKATVILLSATATPDVISDVKQAIGLDDVTVVSDQFDRPNLKFEVYEKSKESAKEIISIVSSGEGGLVYCPTKRECEETSALLEAAGISSPAYHAEISKTVKESLQQQGSLGTIEI